MLKLHFYHFPGGHFWRKNEIKNTEMQQFFLRKKENIRLRDKRLNIIKLFSLIVNSKRTGLSNSDFCLILLPAAYYLLLWNLSLKCYVIPKWLSLCCKVLCLYLNFIKFFFVLCKNRILRIFSAANLTILGDQSNFQISRTNWRVEHFLYFSLPWQHCSYSFAAWFLLHTKK